MAISMLSGFELYSRWVPLLLRRLPTAPRLKLDFACGGYDSVRDWNSFASSSNKMS